MADKNTNQPKFRGVKTFKDAIRNTDGVSAVEFALIAPFMLLLYFGTTEVSLLMQSERQVTSAASTMGDIAARSDIITDSDMQDIFGSTEIVLQTLDSAEAGMRISSLVADAEGNVTVAWSDARHLSPLSEGSTVNDLPEGIVPENGSVIMAELEYSYTPELGYFLKESRSLNEKFYLRPRRVDQIVRQRDEND